ncbi:MAG TPA: RDD family protein [Candidatus Dormibacteraeota bacterium]|jgi:hypothetical protein
MLWSEGRAFVEDSVAASTALPGTALRDAFLAGIPRITLGLIRSRGNSLVAGPIEILRFGRPEVARRSVDWPIEGGLATGRPGGRWRIESSAGRIVASIEGYSPRLPRLLYTAGQLPIHHLITRLFLLGLRGRDPAPGPGATSSDRLRAAAVDIAFCAALAGLLTRRPRARALLGIAVAYHIACWTISGRTLGGLVMKQRVVAIDGSRVTPGQAAVRLLALPLSWLRGRPDHDEVARTDVVSDSQ